MIWHGLLGRKMAEHTNPSNTLYNSLSSYFVEFFWKTGLLILLFKCDIYGRVLDINNNGKANGKSWTSVEGNVRWLSCLEPYCELKDVNEER